MNEAVKKQVAAETAAPDNAPEVAHDYTWGEMEALEKAAKNSPEDFEKFETAKAEFLRKMGFVENFSFVEETRRLCERQKSLLNSKACFYGETEKGIAAITASFAQLKKQMDALRKGLVQACAVAEKQGKNIVAVAKRESKDDAKVRQRVANGIANLAEDIRHATLCESVITKPFSWPRYVPAELQAFIPKIEKRLTNEDLFLYEVQKIVTDDSPRKVVDALTQIATELCESITSMKSKLPGLELKCKRNSGCSANEVKTAQSFRKKFAANIEAQERKLMFVNKAHTKVCAALVKCAWAYHEKFYEMLSGRGCKVEKFELTKEINKEVM